MASIHPLSLPSHFRPPPSGKTVKIGNDVYDLPDQIWDIARFPRGVMVENALIIKTSSDVKNSLAINVGISLDGKLISQVMEWRLFERSCE